MAKTLEPVGNRVVMVQEEAPKASRGGIIIPELAQSAAERPRYGRIIAIGPGKEKDDGTLVPIKFKIGDLAVFAARGGNVIKVEDKEYLVIPADEILALVV